MKIFHINQNSVKFSSFSTKILLLLLVLCYTIIINIAVATTEKCIFENTSSSSSPSLLLSAAKEELMNFNANPCNNFYEYACGNWHFPYNLRALKAHDSLTATSACNKQQLLKYFEGQMDENEERRVDMIEQLKASSTISTTNQSSHYAVRKFYKSCMEKDIEPKNHAKVYMAALQQLNASRILNYSLINKNARQAATTIINNNNHLKWWNIAAELRLLGVDIFWQLLLRPNWQSAEQQIFYLVPPKFGYMQQDNINNNFQKQSIDIEEIIFLQKRHVKYLFLDLGLRTRPAIKLANELVEFELALMQLKNHEDSFILNAPQTLQSWSQQMPNLNLQAYFQNLLLQLPEKCSHEHDNDDDDNELNKLQQMLLVVDIKYMRKLEIFLAKTEPHMLARYMLIKYLTHFEMHLNDEQDYMEHKLYCLQQLQHFMPREISQLFIELEFKNNTQYINHMYSELSSLFQKLKNQFKISLQQTKIFQNDTSGRLRSLEKLNDMRLILPQLQHIIKITTDYNLTTLYSENLLKLWRLRVHRDFAELSLNIKSNVSDLQELSSDDDTLTLSPLDVNAYYRLKKNVIELPVGMLTASFYNSCMSRPQLYGRLLYIIAHELLHGYDFDGLNYDKTGNMGNSLEPKTIIKYSIRASCFFQEKYSNPAININENIADNEGLRLALETLKAERRISGDDIQEHDLKSFFLNFAQTWCAWEKSHGGIHAKHRERVNNVVSNFEEFSTIYKCNENFVENVCKIC